MGPAVIGYSKSFMDMPMNATNASGAAEMVENVENRKYSVGINVNDDLSISYENEESKASTSTAATAQYTLESTGIQAAYTMGGMTLGVAMNDHKNAAYTQNKDVKDTVFSVEMAF
jgi:predicted porin